MTRRASTIVFAVILLIPVLLLAQGTSSPAALGVAGDAVQPMQEYTSTSECDPTQFYQVASTPEVRIISLALNKHLLRPGDTVTFTGVVRVSDLVVYANCYEQTYNVQLEVSPQQSTVEVTILGETLQFTPSNTGSFSGSATISLSLGSGTYPVTVTASFQGATDEAKTTFAVEAYTPSLSIIYPRAATPQQNEVYPGESILLEGYGWIPNMRVLVVVDGSYNVTANASGHFALRIPIPLNNPPSEGKHTVTVEQANLIQTATFVVRYRTLVLWINAIHSVNQGQNVSVSGRVTALGTNTTVADANVTILFMGSALTFQTDENGTFQTQIWVDTSAKPGTYTLEANVTRRGFRPSTLANSTVDVLPTANVPLIASVAATFAAVGAATSLTIGEVNKSKALKVGATSIRPGAPSGPSSIGPGSSNPQASIGPGAQQVQPKIGTGQELSVGPGHATGTQSGLGEIRAVPFPAPRGLEFCIHCGLQIRRGSAFCPECGLKLR